MDRKMILAIILAVVIVAAGALVFFTGGDDGGDEGITVTDAQGRKVTTSVAPMRIVSCSPSLTEIVYSLGMGDRLVAVTDFCDWPAEVVERKGNSSLVSVGAYFYGANIDVIIGADADLVLLDGGVSAQLAQLDQLADAKINTLVLHPGTNFDEVYSNIDLIGTLCWAEESSDSLIQSMQDRIGAIQDRIGEVDEMPSVAFAVWLGQNNDGPVSVAGNLTFSQDTISSAMGRNAYENETGWPSINLESILTEDPDYILVSLMYVEVSTEQVLHELQNHTLWSSTSAVQNGRVYVFTGQADNVFCRPSPRLVDAIELMAKILHSGAFNVTMPNTMGNDYQEWLSEPEEGGAPMDAQGSQAYGLIAVPEGVNLLIAPAYPEAFVIEPNCSSDSSSGRR